MGNTILDKHYAIIVDNIDNGIVLLNPTNKIILWNPFMEKHSRISSEKIIGKNIFEAFPYLPQSWLELKLQSVRLLKSYSFISWKQHPYLFQFKPKTEILGEPLMYMYQDITFFPVIDGVKTYVSIIIKDMTDNVTFSRKIEEMKDMTRTLVEMSNYDALTSIANRGYIETQLKQEFNRAKRYESGFSIIMIDIDNFKDVNDTHGHLAGDEVLKQISMTVTEHIRNSDLFGRFGGEEFIIILPNTLEDETINVAEKLRHAVEELTITHESLGINVKISLGCALYNREVKDYLQMLHDADLALYYSKKSGRNQTSIFKKGECYSVPCD